MSMAGAAQRNRKQAPTTNKTESKPTGPFKPSSHLAEEWPEVFEKRMMSRDPNGKFDRGPLEEERIIFKDPRPDLEDEENFQESFDWARLLSEAWQVNKQLAVTLHGFRCQGSRLVKTDKGHAIKPEVGEQGWVSQEEYQAARDKYLTPYREQLISLLKKL